VNNSNKNTTWPASTYGVRTCLWLHKDIEPKSIGGMNQGISMVALCTEYRGRWIFPILGFRIVPVPAPATPRRPNSLVPGFH
jgi:hypothetical protein